MTLEEIDDEVIYNGIFFVRGLHWYMVDGLC